MSEKKDGTVRLQFDFAKAAYERLEALKRNTGASTQAEVLRKSLALLEWFVEEVNPEFTLSLENKQGEVIYRIPVKTLLV